MSDPQRISNYPVGRADPSDNRNERFWRARQGWLADLAAGIPGLVKLLGGLSVVGPLTLPAHSVTNRVLFYAEAADTWNALAIGAATWTNLGANSAFTIAASSDVVWVSVTGCALVTPGANCSVGWRLLFDGVTPVLMGGDWVPNAAFINALNGGGALPFGFAAGAHTVQVQVYTSVATTGYCRCLTLPNTEHLHVGITEHIF